MHDKLARGAEKIQIVELVLLDWEKFQTRLLTGLDKLFVLDKDLHKLKVPVVGTHSRVEQAFECRKQQSSSPNYLKLQLTHSLSTKTRKYTTWRN